MKLWLKLLVIVTITWPIVAIAESDIVSSDPELRQKAAELDKLHQSLSVKTEAFNKLVAKKAKGASGAVVDKPKINAAPAIVGALSLEQRVAILEASVAKLKLALSRNGKELKELEELEAMQKAEASAPTLPSTPALAQYTQALSLLRNGELEKAKEAFLQVIQDYPDDTYTTKAWLHLGEIHLKLHNFSEAEKAFKEALDRKLDIHSSIQAKLGLAEALFSLHKNDECREQLQLLQKELLDSEQKKRLNDLLAKTKG